jgi:imidazolonepropionase-like amidohydrolase
MLRSIGVGMLLLSGWVLADTGQQRSVILMLGKPAGEMVRSVEADGSVHVHYEFNDRGRGPKLDSVYRVGADASVTEARTQGVNYLKGKVDESYVRDGDQARWKNNSEDETRTLNGPAFYSSMDGPPEELALLARALLAAPDRSLPMLPVGEAKIEKVQDQSVRGKAGTAKLGLYAISGLDLVPLHLWLDEDRQLFAMYSPWQSTVRAGYEDVLPALGKTQDGVENAASEKRARALTQRLERPLLIENVRVFDPGTLQITSGRNVLIDKGRIVDVVAASGYAMPEGVQRLDGGGKFLMPGLWDMHAHISAGTTPLIDIAAGVTTVRDLANDEAALKALIDGIEAGRDIGPRVIRAGFIDGRGPYAGPTKVFADTEAEMKQAIDHYADAGFEQIKIYSSIKTELVAPAVRDAHARGLRLSGHVPAFMTARQFVEAGADEIQHINFIALNFLFDKVQDTRTPARFTAVAEHFGSFDLGSAEVRDFLALLRERKVVVDPTVSTFEGMFLARTNDPSFEFSAIAHRLPATWQRGIASGNGGLEVPKGGSTRYRMAYQKLIDLTGMLHRAGVTLVAGTDGTAGFSLVRELELYAAAGIAPKDALRIATLGGAEVMKRDKDYGRVAPGYVADLILVDGDPTQWMGDLRKVDTVIRGDRMFDSAALFKSVGVKPWR